MTENTKEKHCFSTLAGYKWLFMRLRVLQANAGAGVECFAAYLGDLELSKLK